MIRSFAKWSRSFRRDEDGGVSTIEFLIWFPFFVWVAWSGVDLGIMSFSHSNLERSLDETIREVRLNRLPAGEAAWTHDLLKRMVCERARHIQNCSSELALEMKSIDPRIGNQLSTQPYCVDTPAEIRKPTDVAFENGTSNELMIIRACLEIKPVWGFTLLGDVASRNPKGEWELHATTVFVHEPFGGGSGAAPATAATATGTGG